MKKVVIIDDEPWTRGVIRSLAHWDALGMEVVGEAADGETGLELIEKVLPDVIITDVRMPRLGGLELVKALRTMGLRMPVLIISGYDDFSYVRGALQLGVTDYLLKPIRAEELNEQLKRCLRRLAEADADPPQAPLQTDFFAEEWRGAYDCIEGRLKTALHLGNAGVVKEQFRTLRETLERREGKSPSAGVLMGVYYALLWTLQKHLEEAGLTREAAFPEKNTAFVFSRDNTAEQMLDFVCGLYLSAIEEGRRLSRQRNRLDIDAICRYLEENYAGSVTLEQTADTFHVTKEYLSKAFKAAKAQGFTEYVTGLRMKRAYSLITEFDAPLKEVGAMVGYFDLAHFYKTFKKHFGKTPGEVRESLKKPNETTP